MLWHGGCGRAQQIIAEGDDIMPVKHASAIPLTRIETGKKVSRQILIASHEAPHFAMRRFVIETGGEMPRHTNSVEHEHYVLGGRAVIGIGEEIYHVQKNDVIFISANVPHWYKVESGENFEFLCLVPNQPDKMEIMK
jgi:quercetin dioxygenase-like cupin family protein